MPRGHVGAARSASQARQPRILSPGTQALLAALFAFILYFPATRYGWVWDDQLLAQAHGAGGVAAGGFRPFAALLYRMEWLLGYGTPVVSHLTSILLHALATWLFYRLALHVGAHPGIAFASAILFAAHPVHVEAVAYVSGRPDLLATVLAIAALLWARLPGICSPEGCRSWRIWPAYLAMAAAVLSEEVAIVTPLLLMGLDRWGPVRVPWRRRLTHYSGFFAIVLVYLLVRFGGGVGATAAAGTAQSVSGVEAAARAWAIPIAFFQYLKTLVIPYPLSAFRTLKAAEAASIANRIAPFLALAVLAGFVAWRRRDPLARAGALFLLVPLLPALPIPGLIGSFAEDRAIYFASVGFCLLVGALYMALAVHWPRLRPAIAIGSVAVAGLAGVGTVLRLPAWHDNLTLLQAAAQADPHDPGPHLILAEHYAADSQWNAALEEVDRALAINPKDHASLARKAAFLSQLGRYEESAATARKAVAADPRDATSYANLCDALLQTGKIDEAVEASRRAIEIDSTLVNGWYNYGVALSAKGDTDGAISAYRKAIALQPNNVLALNNLGTLMGSTGRLEEARDLYIKLVAADPGSIQGHMNLALAYLRLGDRERASRERETVRRLDPRAVRQLDQFFLESGVGAGGTGGQRR